MATVTKPLALDESINTTEQTPRNVADVLAQGLDAIEQAIAGGSGSGGHVIEDTNGTTLAQRADLQFVGVYTEDDSANDRTKVNVVRTMTKAAMDALSAAEKVGFIRTSDEADNPYQQIDASDVSYGSTTVEDALDDLSGDLTNISSDLSSLLTKINFQSSIKKITVGQSGTTFNIFIYTTNLQQAFYLLSFSATNIDYYTWDGSDWALLWRK